MVRRRVVALLVGLLVGGVILAPAQASVVVTMQELIDGGSFIVGDKLFANWDYEITGNGEALDPSNITITAYEVNPGLFYLDYQAGYGVEYDPITRIPENLSVVWHYTVETTTGLPLIKDISLYLQGYGIKQGPQPGTGGSIFFSETVADGPASSIPKPNTLADILCTANSNAAVAEWSPPVSKIWVTKALSMYSGLGGASLTEFRQDFSQVVPEASTFILFGLGLVGAGLCRRRKR